MKYTDTELEEILNQLIASTRSPRGRFSAAASYPELEKRLKSHTRHLTLIRTFSAAAAVALLCLSVWTAYLYMQPVTIQTVSTLAETRTVCLPDGSTVTLNHYSSLSYPEKFKSDKREVKLNGEAYFEVSKNKELPFVVSTGKLSVKVLGTKFNLKSYEEDSELKVTLKEGAVKVGDFLIDAAPVELKPNQRFTLRKADLSMQVDSVDASHIDNWRNGAMTFDKVPLEEIAKELKRLYNIPIRIESDKLKQIVYYSDFQENVSVEKVLEILSSGNKFRYEIKSEEIRIFN